MKRLAAFAVAAGVAVLAADSIHAQPARVGGSSIFGLYCATCHGRSAKGDGPMASMLSKRPADLTTIARRNGGAFPSDVVARVIDGRNPVKGHGGSDMPVWGDAFSRSSDPMPVEEKIARLVTYLESIQVKP